MSVSIAVVVPVLRRPHSAQPLVDSLAATDPDAELWFVCSAGDEEQLDACDQTGMPFLTLTEPPGTADYSKKIQLGYGATRAPYVLCGADDLRFHAGWDAALLRTAEEFDVGVVGTNDLANPKVIAGLHATHPLVARCYIDTFGGYVGGPGRVYFEGYDHQLVDVELVETAKARGCYAHCHDSKVEHRHPIFDRSVPRDATYEKAHARGAEDRRLYESRRHLWERQRERTLA